MDKKEFIQYLRINRIIKGNRPAFIYLKKNFGNIYNGKKSNFILSIRKNELIFQKVTFFKGLKPQDDFILDLNNFLYHKVINYNILFNSLCLYDKGKNFIEIFFDINRKDSHETEINISDIIKKIIEFGIKELPSEEDYDEKSNN